ncbi:MAG: hypothetical protein A2X18_01985 [Bacteroidetes bacterium GWF2_40_14]|nr:MAG: hypothetical protein A2X18_01985 [Bacteroidetes bacterium GWF2_40_14]
MKNRIVIVSLILVVVITQSTVCSTSRTTKQNTSGTNVTDIDGNVYPIIIIGQREWMGSNLKTSRYSDGKIIASGTKDRFFSKSAQEPAFVWYNNDSINEKEYGRLYNYFAVLDELLCPIGWHIPDEEDWQSVGIDINNFNIQLGGYMNPNDLVSFHHLGETGFWWSSASVGRNTGMHFYIKNEEKKFVRGGSHESYFLSVRCVRQIH